MPIRHKKPRAGSSRRRSYPSRPDLKKLVRGLTHEVRSPLAGIKAALEVLRETENLSEQGQHVLREMDREVAQIDRIVCQFLDFGLLPTPELESVPVGLLVESVRDRLSRAPKAFQMRVLVPQRLSVHVDVRIFQRALAEIVQNSIDHGATVVAVRAGQERGGVWIRLTNDGQPVDRQIADRIFEPFFSTLPRRAGLGLPVAKRWLRTIDGAIALLPRRNGFQVTLPKGK